MSDQATIFALSSGRGRAGVAVIRISGSKAASVLAAMASPCPSPRKAAFRRIVHPVTRELLDAALVLFFAGPSSETGEDIGELQLHGSPAVVRAVLAALSAIPGCRMAEPGEFARRAFLNGKIDLTAAEGLADLIDAETDAQRRQALAQAGGAFARLCDRWRDRLIEARALAEAAIDFSDEGDVSGTAMAEAHTIALSVAMDIETHLAAAHRGEIVRDGFRVVLAGPPNVGKSSLLNALARRDVAIVSPEAGTTRDVLEVHLDLGGYAVVVADTAGLREAEGAVELEGIRRTRDRAGSADLVLWLVDATTPDWKPPADLSPGPGRLLVVINKSDLAAVSPPSSSPAPAVAVSALTGAGLPDLVAELARHLQASLGAETPSALPTQARHRAALADCHAALVRVQDQRHPGYELAAEDLRLAADALGRITGHIDAEAVLGQIFGRFCIGK